MVAGWPYGTKGILYFLLQDEVRREDPRARRTQRGLHGMRTHCGIRIDVANAVFRNVGDHRLDMLHGVRPGNLLKLGDRGVVKAQVHVDPCRDQTIIDCRQAVRAFRMMVAHVVQPALAMRNECS